MTDDWLRIGMDLCGLTEHQRRACWEAWYRLQHSPKARKAFLRDLTHLQDASQQADISLPSKLQHDIFNNDMYPVLLILRAAIDTEKRYAEMCLPMQVLRDTLKDLPIWMDHCKISTGHWGLNEYRWLSHTIHMRLFRLGRLEYVYSTFDADAQVYRCGEQICCLYNPTQEKDFVFGQAVSSDGCLLTDTKLDPSQWMLVLKKGDPVLDVHIPADGPLTEVDESFSQAPAFFVQKLHLPEPRALVCHSWLLAPDFEHIMPNGNIARFGSHFHRLPCQDDDSQCLERLYHRAPGQRENLPRNTTLQRAAADWYLQNKRINTYIGFYLPARID